MRLKWFDWLAFPPLALGLMSGLLLLMAQHKTPIVTAEHRADFEQAAKHLAEWQATMLQAQLMIAQAQADVTRTHSVMERDCTNGFVLSADKADKPICVEKPKR